MAKLLKSPDFSYFDWPATKRVEESEISARRAERARTPSRSAPLTMVEYLDFQCPFCKNFEATTFADIPTFCPSGYEVDPAGPPSG
jgi:hypothetical protein